MASAPTIYDVAERAGVSKSLVSLVLRGSERVSDEKRLAVLQAVKALNYTPSRLAAGLAGTRTRSIGVVIDEFENLWFADVLAGLRKALDGYSISVADTALNSHLSIDPLEAFRGLRVDGVVLAGEVPSEAVERLSVPAAILGIRAMSAPRVPVVANDEEAGGRLAVSHLAGLGHRRIACVSAPGASAGAREAGYLSEMGHRGLEPRVIRAEHTTEAAVCAVASELFDEPGPFPTAVFAVNDPMAVGVIGEARDRGIEVPRDLSVVGYDDSPIAAYDLLSLTTVSGDPVGIGEATGRTLVEMIEGDADPEPMRLFEPQLVVRRSTGPLEEGVAGVRG